MTRRHPAKTRHKIRRKPDPRISVTPSPEIEARVDHEVEHAVSIARGLTPDNYSASGYLVSTIYYHDGLLDHFNADQPTADPADRIVARIARQMPANTKRAWVQLLRQQSANLYSESGEPCFLIPVPYEPIGAGRNVHPSAIDLFVNEGTPVRSATRGIVVLAEDGWHPDQWFSTSSVRGGNAVIVFDPGQDLFYRYAHLEAANATPGSWVEPGDIIGAVGHTGFNATRQGHGRHLHFEINEFDPRTGLVSALPHDDLEALLEAARVRLPAAPAPTAITREAIPESAPSTGPQSAPE